MVFVRISRYLPKSLKKISDFWLRQYFQAEKRTTGLCCSSNFAYWTKCTRFCSKIYFTFLTENNCLCCQTKRESFACCICDVYWTQFFRGPNRNLNRFCTNYLKLFLVHSANAATKVCPEKKQTGLNIIIGIVQKVYE